MFKRFKKPAATFGKKPAAPAAVVKDSLTHRVIYRGTLADCQAYQVAFRVCYVETV